MPAPRPLKRERALLAALCRSQRDRLELEEHLEELALLAQTAGDPSFVPAILAACRAERIPIRGVLGEWTVTKALWDSLCRDGLQPTFQSKEIRRSSTHYSKAGSGSSATTPRSSLMRSSHSATSRWSTRAETFCLFSPAFASRLITRN